MPLVSWFPTPSYAHAVVSALDGVGNQLTNGITGQRATYDSRMAVTTIGAATYDGFSQGNGETVSRANPAASWTSASIGLVSQTSGTATHVFTRDTRGNALAARQGTNRLYYVLDATDSVIGVFDATGTFTGGYSYSPYGELRAATNHPVLNDNPLRFTSGLWDATAGLYRLGARYYDPSLGRFTQYDPTGQEPNPYLYAAGNPANFVDPTGTKPQWGSVVGALGAFVGITAALAVCSTGVGCIGLAALGGLYGGGAGGFVGGYMDGKRGSALREEVSDQAIYGFLGGLTGGAWKARGLAKAARGR